MTRPSGEYTGDGRSPRPSPDPSYLEALPDPQMDPAAAALARTLQADVEALQSADRLTELRGRVRGSHRRSWAQVAVAGMVAAAMVTAVAVVHEHPAGIGAQRTSPPTPSSSTSGGAGESGRVSDPHPLPVYYLGRDGSRWALYREFHQQTPSEQQRQPDPLMAALRAALTAGTALDPDLNAPWSAAASQAAITVSHGVVTVDLAEVEGRKRGRSSEQARLALQQLVWTASAAKQDAALRVRVLIAGRPGLLFGAEPVGNEATRADSASVVIGSVWVVAPDEGQYVVSPVTVRGSVCTQDPNLNWQLLQDGVVLRSGQAKVQSRCPTRSPWSVPLGQLAPGRYTLRAFRLRLPGTPSSPQDTRTFTVR